MTLFSGFDPQAVALLDSLPECSADRFTELRSQLQQGLQEPGAQLIEGVAGSLDPSLTVSRRSSVSPLQRDLRFAKAGSPRYKDHLLLTAWQGAEKKNSPTLWLRLGARSMGFASGLAFTHSQRERWREAVAGNEGEALAQVLNELRKRQRRHHFEVSGQSLKRVPKPWPEDHPRADLLRLGSVQARFQVPLPKTIHRPAFEAWCAERLAELLPVHRWLLQEVVGDSAPVARSAARAPRDGSSPARARKPAAAKTESTPQREAASAPRDAAAEALFWELAGELCQTEPRLQEGTIMKARCLRFGKEFLALVDYKGSGLVVKLPAERVAALIDNGSGQPFAPAGRVFKEWLSVPRRDRRRWRSLLHEGMEHAAGK